MGDRNKKTRLIVVWVLLSLAVILAVGGGLFLLMLFGGGGTYPLEEATPTATATSTGVSIGISPPIRTPEPTRRATATPTPQPTPTATAGDSMSQPTEITTPGPIEVAEAEGVFGSYGTPVLGQLAVDRPPRMSPGSTGSFFASLRIPELYASIIPVEIEIITVPKDEPVEVGVRKRDYVALHLIETMGMEIIAPAFQPVTADPVIQTVNLEESNLPTFWSWTLTAPEAIGLHEVELRVYQVKGEQRRLAIPPRIYQIEVVALTPTPEPTAAWTPTPTVTLTPSPMPAPMLTPVPFLQTPLGTTLVGGGFTIVVALIGLVGVYMGRERLPFINMKASKQRRLIKLQSNLNYLQEQAAGYGSLEVPVRLRNEIEAAQVEIAELEKELKALER